MADPCGDRQLVAANWRLASPVAPVTAEREREREREGGGSRSVNSHLVTGHRRGHWDQSVRGSNQRQSGKHGRI